MEFTKSLTILYKKRGFTLVTSLFSYRRASSILHKMNAGFKFFSLILLSLFLFSKINLLNLFHFQIDNSVFIFQWIKVFFIFTLSSILFLIAKIPFSKILQLRAIVFLGLFFIVFKIINIDISFTPDFHFDFSFHFLDGLDGFLWASQFFTASFLALIFFDTTSTTELQESFSTIEKFFSRFIPPLKKINISIYLTLAISFIPEIFASWEKIQKASRARQKTHSRIKLKRRIAIFINEFSSLLSLMLVKAMQKRQALMNRSL